MKNFIKILVPSIIGSGLTIAVFMIAGLNHQDATVKYYQGQQPPVHQTLYTVKENGEYIPLDFTEISSQVMNSVVHVRSTRKVQSAGNQYYYNQCIKAKCLGKGRGNVYFYRYVLLIPYVIAVSGFYPEYIFSSG